MISSRIRNTLALGISIASARPVLCQQLRLIQAGVQPAHYAQIGDTPPSTFVLTSRSVGWSVFGALTGGLVGLDVDDAYCKRHHGNEQGTLFGPCFLYASEGFATGWFGGAIVGSTLGAVRVAEKRGCARRTAIMRATIGAAIGSAPGVAIVARRSGNYPPSRAIFIAAAPLLSGFGAAVAVLGCHAS